MNAARKLIAFVADAATRVCSQLEHPECTVGDLQDARRTVAHIRADLVELDQRISAEITRRIARPVGLIPHRDSLCGPTGPQSASPAFSPQAKSARDGASAPLSDREYANDAQRARVESCVGPDLGRGHVLVPATVHEPVDHAAAIESPDRANRTFRPAHPLMPAFRPTHRFSPQLRRLIALSPVISAPGRKAS